MSVIDKAAELDRKHAEMPTLYPSPSDGSYEVPAACFNCRWRGRLRMPRGFKVPLACDCPNCGCREVRTVPS